MSVPQKVASGSNTQGSRAQLCQCRCSAAHRIQGGMGRFCLAFLASFFLMAKRFWDGCTAQERRCEAGINQRRLTELTMAERQPDVCLLHTAPGTTPCSSAAAACRLTGCKLLLALAAGWEPG